MTRRSCPGCRGYLHLNRDVYGTYHECLECGHVEDVKVRRPQFPTSKDEERVA